MSKWCFGDRIWIQISFRFIFLAKFQYELYWAFQNDRIHVIFNLKWPKTIQIFFVFEKQCPNLIENGKIGAKKWGKFFNFRIESSPCPVLTSVYKNFELSNKAIWRWAVFIVISEPNPNLNSNRFVKSTEYEYRYYLSQKLWPNMNIIWSKMFSWIRMAR